MCTESLFCASCYREVHIRPDFCSENWLPQYLETDFYKHYRMSRELFGKLLTIIIKQGTKCFHGGYLPVSPEKCLLITLWYLSRGESFVSIGDRFNVSDSTVLHVTEKCITIIANLINIYITWPNKEECILIEQFASLAGYPVMCNCRLSVHTLL